MLLAGVQPQISKFRHTESIYEINREIIILYIKVEG